MRRKAITFGSCPLAEAGYRRCLPTTKGVRGRKVLVQALPAVKIGAGGQHSRRRKASCFVRNWRGRKNKECAEIKLAKAGASE